MSPLLSRQVRTRTNVTAGVLDASWAIAASMAAHGWHQSAQKWTTACTKQGGSGVSAQQQHRDTRDDAARRASGWATSASNWATVAALDTAMLLLCGLAKGSTDNTA